MKSKCEFEDDLERLKRSKPFLLEEEREYTEKLQMLDAMPQFPPLLNGPEHLNERVDELKSTYRKFLLENYSSVSDEDEDALNEKLKVMDKDWSLKDIENEYETQIQSKMSPEKLNFKPNFPEVPLFSHIKVPLLYNQFKQFKKYVEDMNNRRSENFNNLPMVVSVNNEIKQLEQELRALEDSNTMETADNDARKASLKRAIAIKKVYKHDLKLINLFFGGQVGPDITYNILSVYDEKAFHDHYKTLITNDAKRYFWYEYKRIRSNKWRHDAQQPHLVMGVEDVLCAETVDEGRTVRAKQLHLSQPQGYKRWSRDGPRLEMFEYPDRDHETRESIRLRLVHPILGFTYTLQDIDIYNFMRDKMAGPFGRVAKLKKIVWTQPPDHLPRQKWFYAIPLLEFASFVHLLAHTSELQLEFQMHPCRNGHLALAGPYSPHRDDIDYGNPEAVEQATRAREIELNTWSLDVPVLFRFVRHMPITNSLTIQPVSNVVKDYVFRRITFENCMFKFVNFDHDETKRLTIRELHLKRSSPTNPVRAIIDKCFLTDHIPDGLASMLANCVNYHITITMQIPENEREIFTEKIRWLPKIVVLYKPYAIYPGDSTRIFLQHLQNDFWRKMQLCFEENDAPVNATNAQ